MRIPRKVKIGHHEVKVIYKKNLFMDDEQKIPLLGYCDNTNNIIYLKKGLEKNKKEEVFFHESLHHIDENYSLSLGEKKVNALTNILLSFIKDNKLDFLKE